MFFDEPMSGIDVGSKQGISLTKLENRQRFNVALSRAKDRMYLYRRINEIDLKNQKLVDKISRSQGKKSNRLLMLKK